MDFFTGSVCYSCRLPFTEEEWDQRHFDDSGEDVHEECCEICLEESFGLTPTTERKKETMSLGSYDHIVNVMQEKLMDAQEAQYELQGVKDEITDALEQLDTFIDNLEALITSLPDDEELLININVSVEFQS